MSSRPGPFVMTRGRGSPSKKEHLIAGWWLQGLPEAAGGCQPRGRWWRVTSSAPDPCAPPSSVLLPSLLLLPSLPLSLPSLLPFVLLFVQRSHFELSERLSWALAQEGREGRRDVYVPKEPGGGSGRLAAGTSRERRSVGPAGWGRRPGVQPEAPSEVCVRPWAGGAAVPRP